MPSRRDVLARLAAGGMSVALGTPGWRRAAAAQERLRSFDVFQAGAELVPSAVTVRDGEGRLVTSLQQGDFTVAESGADQPITQFTRLNQSSVSAGVRYALLGRGRAISAGSGYPEQC